MGALLRTRHRGEVRPLRVNLWRDFIRYRASPACRCPNFLFSHAVSRFDHALTDLRVLGGEIGGLGTVLGEVIKFPRFGAEADEL